MRRAIAWLGWATVQRDTAPHSAEPAARRLIRLPEDSPGEEGEGADEEQIGGTTQVLADH